MTDSTRHYVTQRWAAMAGVGGAAAIARGALLDTRSLAKLAPFDGAEEAWPAWRFVFERYAMLLSTDLYKHTNKTADLDENPYIREIGGAVVSLPRVLFELLLGLVHKTALSIMMSVEKGNGLQGWRRPKR
jgi:hypothetical protein